MAIRIVDVTGDETFGLVPPCADAGFDHRSCDYWEDADRGSKAARASWLTPTGGSSGADGRGGGIDGGAGARGSGRASGANPFAADLERTGGPPVNPFAAPRPAAPINPFLVADDEPIVNPFAPPPRSRPPVAPDARPKLRLLARGLRLFGSYAKVLLEDDLPSAYTQFGPLSAYPRAMRLRDLYPRLPQAPLPAVITCIATTAAARDRGLAAVLVDAVCDDLESRGFSAVETYPEVGTREDATSAAEPGFWEGLGFVIAAPDERFPVMRRELR